MKQAQRKASAGIDNLLSIFTLGRRLKKKTRIKLDDPTTPQDLERVSESAATHASLPNRTRANDSSDVTALATPKLPERDLRASVSSPILHNQWLALQNSSDTSPPLPPQPFPSQNEYPLISGYPQYLSYSGDEIPGEGDWNGSPSVNIAPFASSGLVVTNPDRPSISAEPPTPEEATPQTPPTAPIAIPISNSPFATARKRLPSDAAGDQFVAEDGRLAYGSPSYAATFGAPSTTNLAMISSSVLAPPSVQPPTPYSEAGSVNRQPTLDIEYSWSYNVGGSSEPISAPDGSPSSSFRPFNHPPLPANYSFVGSISSIPEAATSQISLTNKNLPPIPAASPSPDHLSSQATPPVPTTEPISSVRLMPRPLPSTPATPSRSLPILPQSSNDATLPNTPSSQIRRLPVVPSHFHRSATDPGYTPNGLTLTPPRRLPAVPQRSPTEPSRRALPVPPVYTMATAPQVRV